MDDIRLRLDQALAGRYRLERELGRGGMGLVFLADDVKHDRKVALKVLRPEVAESLGADRFLREIRISAQLNHPNILTLIDSGSAGEFMYYVLPFVEGESLRDLLKRQRQLPIEDALRITREAADALSHAHHLGIVHRDIKPENILFEAGHAVVADFGIARAVSEAAGGDDKLTQTGVAIGTPAYMSPEQALGSGPVDARADIYSLACVLYEMLAGEPPYGGPTPQAILARKTLEPVPGLRVVRDTVPPAVEAAIVRALSKVPADRYTTAGEFAAALTSGPAPRAVLRGPVPITAAVVVVVAAAAYIALALAGNTGGSSSGMAATTSRLTSDPGVEWFPSLSPDGKWLVYAGEAAGNRDIYLQSVGGQNPINLTADSPADDDQPAFSPDGERIAFRSAREGGGLYVMGRTGEAVRRVGPNGYKPTWSPDGTQLAYATENVEVNPQNSERQGQLWIVDLPSGKTRLLEVNDASLPSWSPHGHRIAYFSRLSAAAQGHIWTAPVAGGEPRAVTSGTGRNWNPAWSPDGRYLYYVSDRGGSMNLWRVRVDEESGRALADPEAVTTPATSLAHIALSADGRRIAYSSVLVTTNVQRAAFDPVRGTMAGEPEWLTRGSRRWANPAPSPDGGRLVFYTLVDPEGDLFVMSADGRGSPRQLTSDSASDRVPRWSPDGNWIAVFSNRSGPLQVWKIRPDGSGLAQVTDAPTNTAYPVWSPDGTRMAAATTRSALTYVFDPHRPWAEQHVDTLPAPPDSLQPFGPHDWSPDGRRLAGMISAVDRGIVVHVLGSARYERLTTFGQWPVWLPDSRRLLFVSGGNAFYVLDRETRTVRKIFSVPRDVIGPPQLTLDGRAVYFTRRVTEADVWMATLQ